VAYRQEFNITGWLDPFLEHFARQAGIPTADYSAQVGGEGLGVVLEGIADLFTKGWLNKLIQFATGLIASGYAVYGKDVPIRLRKELLALGTHELLRIVDPSPQDIQELKDSVNKLTNAVKKGDALGALISGLRSPNEIQSMLGITKQSTSPTPSSPPPASAPAPASPTTKEQVKVDVEVF